MSRPILLDYITPRRGEDEKLFVYDYFKDMNVLRNNKDLEFIEYGKAECVTQTETRVAREADDKEYSLCELESKTEVSRERDDEEINFAELTTKTAEGRERDDEELSFLAEINTKTFVDRERDDDDDYYLN